MSKYNIGDIVYVWQQHLGNGCDYEIIRCKVVSPGRIDYIESPPCVCWILRPLNGELYMKEQFEDRIFSTEQAARKDLVNTLQGFIKVSLDNIADHEQQIHTHSRRRLSIIRDSWLLLHQRRIRMKTQPTPEIQWLESVMASRIDQFKHHKWKPGDTGYWVSHWTVDHKLQCHVFKVTDITDTGRLKSRQCQLDLYPADVSFDKLAAIAIKYFNLNNPALYEGLPEAKRLQLVRDTRLEFFKQLLKTAEETQ